MTTPTHCASCGHELGGGRFCTSCEQPVPGRHPQAASVRSAPVVPPPTGELPPAARYPLYADAPVRRAPAPAGPPAPPSPPPGRSGRLSWLPWLPWLLGVAMVVLVAGIGAFLVTGSGGGDRAGAPGGERTDDARPATPSSGAEPRPDRTGTEGPVEAPSPGDVRDLTPTARAQVPATAPASRDRRNRPVTYVADNLLDGRPRTAWRMAGDGAGAVLVLDLGEEVVLTEVGLVNGYAKVDGADDWYRANRRIRAVQWEFDDGTRITQRLTDRRTMQLMPVGPVATTRVVLHLVEVSAPGRGPAGRDFTAISDVRLRGAALSL